MVDKDQAQLVAETIDKVTDALDNENLSLAEALGILAFVQGGLIHNGFLHLQGKVEESAD
jgi:hypothetical protein